MLWPNHFIVKKGDEMRYKIFVKTIQGTVLNYSVEEFKVIDGFVVFIDSKTLKEKRFPIDSCEIEGDVNV